MLNKIGEGAWTLYLYECPRCGCTRKLDEEKAVAMAGLTAAGLATSAIFGAPLAGLLGGLGLFKLAMAGTIAGPVAVRAIRENYRLIAEMSKRSYFTCPHCGCTDLVRGDNVDQDSLLWNRIKDIFVAQLGVNPEQVVPEACLIDDLGADDLDYVELIMAVEEEFGLAIPEEDAEGFEKVGDYFHYLKRHGL